MSSERHYSQRGKPMPLPQSSIAMLLRHDDDLYRGDNRNPGLTTRMQEVETCTRDIEKDMANMSTKTEARMAAQDSKLTRIGLQFWAIIILLIGVLISIAVTAHTGAKA